MHSATVPPVLILYVTNIIIRQDIKVRPCSSAEAAPSLSDYIDLGRQLKSQVWQSH